MKKFDFKNYFPIIYEVLAYIYVIFMFAYSLITSKTFNIYIIPTKMMNFSIIICYITFIVFIADILLNKNKIKKILKKELIPFLIFIIWCLISTILSENKSSSIYGIIYRFSGFIQYLSYFMFAILGFSLSDKGRKRYFRIFIIISTLMGIITLFKNDMLPVSGTISGIFYNTNHYAYYLVYAITIIIFLFLNDKNIILKIIDFFIYLLHIYILIINNTFGCYIAILFVLICLFIYLLKRKKLVLFYPLIISFIFLSLVTIDNSKYVIKDNFVELINDLNIAKETSYTDDYLYDYTNPVHNIGNFRGALWLYGIRYTLEKPLFGYGLDNLSERYLKDYVYIDDPHNLIINLSATIGIPGMISYIVGLIIILYKGLKKMKKQNDHLINLCYFVIIAHLVSEMFGITIYYVTPYFVIILGMAVKSLYEENNQDLT